MRVEQLGGVGERLAHPVGAEDRQAVAAQHHLGAARRPSGAAPPPSRWRSAAPSAGCRRSGTAQMNRSPGWRTPQLGHPRPRRVVGLAAGVVQLEREVALGEREVVAVGDVGVAVRRRATEAVDRQRELALVDRRVPAERALVAAEVVGQVLVGVDDRRRPAPARRPRPRSAGCRRRGRCGGGCRRPRRTGASGRHAAHLRRRRGRCRTGRRCRASRARRRCRSRSPTRPRSSSGCRARSPRPPGRAPAAPGGGRGRGRPRRSSAARPAPGFHPAGSRRPDASRIVRLGHDVLEHLDVTRDGDIVTVTLDWPEKRNALAARRDGGAHRGAARRSARRDATGVDPRRQRAGVLGRPQLRRHGGRLARRRP